MVYPWDQPAAGQPTAGYPADDQIPGPPPQPAGDSWPGQAEAPPVYAPPPQAPQTSWPGHPARPPARRPPPPGPPARRRVPSPPGGPHGGFPTLKIKMGGRSGVLTVVVLAIIAAIVIPFAINGVNGWKSALGILGIKLPHVSSPYHPKTTIDPLGPAILEEVKGVDKPALGQATYTFTYQKKVDKSVLLWKCWYSQDYQAYASASAYVALNPGAAWWAKNTGHYVMQRQGHNVTVNLVMPIPTLPPSVHQVSIDNTTSGPIGKPDHSFSYPGLGCGALLNPHFSNDEMGSDMQHIAFSLATGKQVSIPDVTMLHSESSPVIRQRVIASAEAEAKKMYFTDFIGPTVARYGDRLVALNIRWVPQSPN